MKFKIRNKKSIINNSPMNTVCLVSPASLSAGGSTPHRVSSRPSWSTTTVMWAGQAEANLAVRGDHPDLCVKHVGCVDWEVGLHVHLPLKPGGEPHQSLYNHFHWKGGSVPGFQCRVNNSKLQLLNQHLQLAMGSVLMDLITVNYVQDLSPILTKRRRLEPETKAAQTNI